MWTGLVKMMGFQCSWLGYIIWQGGRDFWRYKWGPSLVRFELIKREIFLGWPDLIRWALCERARAFPGERKSKQEILFLALKNPAVMSWKLMEASCDKHESMASVAKSGPWPTASKELRRSVISLREMNSASLEEDPELKKGTLQLTPGFQPCETLNRGRS